MEEADLVVAAQDTGEEWKKLGLILGFSWTTINQFQLGKKNIEYRDIVFDMLVKWNKNFSRKPRQAEDILKKAIKQSRIPLPVEPSQGYLDDDLFLYTVGEHLGSSWKHVGLELRITQAELKRIESDNEMCPSDAAMAMLFMWRSRNDAKHGRFSRLLHAISKSNQDKLAKKLSGSMPQEIDPSQIEFLRGADGAIHGVGSGAFSEVYKAKFVHVEKQVAVKRIHSQTTMPNEMRNPPPLHEFRVMAILRNENVVFAFGMLLDEKLEWYAIVMEAMIYGSVRQVLEKTLVPQSVKTKLVVDMYRGMEFIHGKNMIHRYLKAANVLIDSDFRAKISGFRQAKFVTITATEQKPLGGTATHKAPEMFDADYVSGPPADVWSSGIVLFEIQAEKQRNTSEVWKRLPFNEDTDDLQIMTHIFVMKESPISEEQISNKLAGDAPEIFISHMKSSTTIIPDKRPTFQQLLEDMSEYFKEKFSHIVQKDINDLKDLLGHGDEEIIAKRPKFDQDTRSTYHETFSAGNDPGKLDCETRGADTRETEFPSNEKSGFLITKQDKREFSQMKEEVENILFNSKFSANIIHVSLDVSAGKIFISMDKELQKREAAIQQLLEGYESYYVISWFEDDKSNERLCYALRSKVETGAMIGMDQNAQGGGGTVAGILEAEDGSIYIATCMHVIKGFCDSLGQNHSATTTIGLPLPNPDMRLEVFDFEDTFFIYLENFEPVQVSNHCYGLLGSMIPEQQYAVGMRGPIKVDIAVLPLLSDIPAQVNTALKDSVCFGLPKDLPKTDLTALYAEHPVDKFGAGSGLTTGMVKDACVYRRPNDGYVLVTDQNTGNTFGLEGDSGATVLSEEQPDAQESQQISMDPSTQFEGRSSIEGAVGSNEDVDESQNTAFGLYLNQLPREMVRSEDDKTHHLAANWRHALDALEIHHGLHLRFVEN